MSANKIRGIRACCCSDAFSAEYTRRHNDANALCMGGRVVGPGLGIYLADLFLNTPLRGAGGTSAGWTNSWPWRAPEFLPTDAPRAFLGPLQKKLKS